MSKPAKPAPKSDPIPVVVRQAEERDKDRLVEIMDACWEATWMPFMPPAVPARYRNENLGRAFVENAWQTCRVAEDTTGKHGVTGFSFLLDKQIKTIQVPPKMQHRGVGRALLEDAEAELAKAGHASAYVECDVFNARAAVFYRAMGYEETGRIDTDMLGYKLATHVFEKPLGSK